MSDKPVFDKSNAIIAALVTIIAFIVYYITKAPTLSFWDCGEFIVACYSLAIPHPPGTPLYILIGHIFSLLPLSSDIAVRVNLLSGISSSFATMFAYLALIRLLRKCLPQDGTLLTRLLTYLGAMSGALMMTFSLTNWNNSVEAEVYGLSMLMFMAIFWLSFIYYEYMGTAYGERIMLLVFFIAFLGIGVHLTTFIIIPAVALFFIIKKNSPMYVWFVVAVLVLFELYLIFAFSSKAGEIPYYVPILIVFIFYLFYIFSFEKMPMVNMITAGLFMLPLLPMLAVIMKTATGSVSDSLVSTLTTIGKIGFGVLLLYGFYLLVQYFKTKETDNNATSHLLSSLFILMSGLMVLLLNTIHGYDAYKPFLFISAVLIILVLFFFRNYINWANLIAIGAVSVVVIAVRPFVLALVLASAFLIIAGIFWKLTGWKNALMIIIVACIGYSVHTYIPVRSAQNPKINENNPASSLNATIDYLERKQYGSMSMTKRMFKRRAEWLNQFGDHRRMGFWGFFSEQYGLKGKMFILLFVIGLFGVWETIRKNPRKGLPILILLLVTTVGLVLYMNFADGLRQDPVTGRDWLEVRDRDYFFTPGFMLFGLSIGLGLTFIIQFIRESLKNVSPSLAKIVPVGLLPFLGMPVVALAGNYHYADRSGNYIAYDYAYNLMISAEPNAVFFSAGDNDTFPLWCVQDVYNVRPDISLVNLSLANTTWYTKQLTSNLGVDVNFSDSQVDQFRAYRDQFGNVIQLSDKVITEVIRSNYGKRPINFSVTVPADDRRFMGQSLDSLVELQGMSYALTNNPAGLRKNIDKTLDLYLNKFQYRGIADEDVHKAEATLRITKNYPRSIMLVADSLRKVGEVDSVISIMKFAIEKVPYSEDGINYLGAVYNQYGYLDELRQLIADNQKYGDIKHLKILLAKTILQKENADFSEAEKIYLEVIKIDPKYRPPYDDLMRLYYSLGNKEKFREIVELFLQYNPDDRQMKTIHSQIDKQFQLRDREATDSQ